MKVACPGCGGSGYVRHPDRPRRRACLVCHGAGMVRPAPGEGWLDSCSGLVFVAFTGLVLLITLGQLALFVEALMDEDEPDPGLRETTSEGTFTGLEVGSCVDHGALPTPVDCGVAHDGEVYRILQVATRLGAYPGGDRLQDLAAERCSPHFAAYVGAAIEESSLAISAWVPDRATWDFGVTRVVCLVGAEPPDRLAEVVRDSGR